LYGCRVLLDTSGEALRRGLEAGPDFVKPNCEEASSFAGYVISDADGAVEAAQRFFDAGARSVAISLGSRGIIWQTSVNSDPLISQLPPVHAGSSVGSGDAALAGFAVAYERGLSDEETLSLAVACGTANCLADAPGQVSREHVLRLAQQAQVRRPEYYERTTVKAQ
jgi:fructose-1-phosphate kinase PfkB-like protein